MKKQIYCPECGIRLEKRENTERDGVIICMPCFMKSPFGEKAEKEEKEQQDKWGRTEWDADSR